jgi:EAL domain-containing protein (putative c-di-GMP-specific phosphodiesterase class I)
LDVYGGFVTTVRDDALGRILRDHRLQTVFQPIVRLDDGKTVAFEALVRGPTGSRLASAPALLTEAYRTGRVVDLDWEARASACRAALAADLNPDVPLFLNVEPLALDSKCPSDAREDIDAAYRRLQIVLEVTERSLDRDPRSLLDGIAHVRGMAGGLAVDDVGANAGTLSMLAILEPELIKLDLQVVQSKPTPAIAKILDCVYAESERTGATILAEGVQGGRHARAAVSLGAALAQGRHFGPPAPMPMRPAAPERPLVVRSRPVRTAQTPFDALRGRPISRATARLLMPLGLQVAYSGVDLVESATLLALFPDRHMFGATERDNFSRLACQGVLAGVLGPGIPAHPGGGIRGGHLETDDSLNSEWAIVGLSPHTAGAMLARAIPGTNSEYVFAVTHDRHRVIAAARCLLRRLGPAEGHSPSDVTWDD